MGPTSTETVIRMSTETPPLDIDLFRSFDFLRHWSSEQLRRLAARVRIEQAPSGRLLVSRGGSHDFGLFLLDGWLRLKHPGGQVREVRSIDPEAREALTRGLPEACDVVSVTPVRFFRLTNALMEEIARMEPSVDRDAELQPDIDVEQVAGEIGQRMRQALDEDRLELPSLPEVAIRVTEALDDDVSDASDIAQIVQVDPAITAKLIKAANSALYGRLTPVETCTAAVVRLGSGITQKLVISFAVRELFRSDSGALQQQMWSLWKHSTRIAALCHLLARLDGRFDPEQAMLAGLLHDVGVIAVVQYLDTLKEAVSPAHAVSRVVDRLRAEMSAEILQRWRFAEPFVTAAREAEAWMRNPEDGPDLCDLVVVAQLHERMGGETAAPMPVLGDTPAFGRLRLGDLTMEGRLAINDEMASQLAQTESLLNI